MMPRKYTYLFFVVILLFSACKKDGREAEYYRKCANHKLTTNTGAIMYTYDISFPDNTTYKFDYLEFNANNKVQKVINATVLRVNIQTIEVGGYCFDSLIP